MSVVTLAKHLDNLKKLKEDGAGSKLAFITSTVKGSLLGGAIGAMYAFYKHKPVIPVAVIGSFLGGVVTYIVVPKSE